MRNRLIILIAVNVVLVAATIIFLRMWMVDQNDETQVLAQPAEEEEVIQVLIATENLPTGIMLGKHHWRWADWPEDGVADSYYTHIEGEDSDVSTQSVEESLLGGVVRLGVSKGQPLTTGAIVKPGERGFLAAILKPGYRAASMPINASSASSGLILPGDHVDVILVHSFRIEDDEGNRADRRVSETIIQNVRVLSIDQTLASDGSGAMVGKTATLQVTPRQAERLALGLGMGELSLSLRGLDEQDAPGNLRRTATWDYNASLALGSVSNSKENRDVPTVMRGGNQKK